MSWLVPGTVALVMASVLTACGGGNATHIRTTTTPVKHIVRPYVDIYSGLPLRGPLAKEGRAVWNGIALAKRYQPTRAGAVVINFKPPLDDSGQKTGDANIALALSNAQAVSIDPHAVYYIGDLSSAATGVSLPILNAAGIAQITPGDPYIATATPQAGGASLSPKLLRLQPSYTVQAAADMQFFQKIPPRYKQVACTRVIAVAENDPESKALVAAMYTDAKADGITMPLPVTLTAKTLTAYQASLQHESPAPCGFAIAGSDSKLAVNLTKILHMMFPTALIIGTSNLCNAGWTKAADKGVSADVDHVLWCTSPVWPLAKYARSDTFAKLYERTYHSTPSPYAFYGYEAANLGIAMINFLEAGGDNRTTVRNSLFDAGIREDVYRYADLATGASSLSSYALYNVAPRTAEPAFYLTLRP